MCGRVVELAIDPDLLVPASVFIHNIESAFERNVPRLITYAEQLIVDSATQTYCTIPWSTKPAVLVAGGPSLHTELDRLRAIDGDIFGCGTNHDFLMENGIIPKYHVICDPGPETVNFIKKPNKEVIYLLSSSCAPETFDALEGYRIYLWHSNFTKNDEDITICDYHNEPSIRVGGSVLLAAFPLAYIAGYRKFHFFGFDCSFPEWEQGQHAYKYDFFKEEPVIVHIGDKKYYTTPGFMIQLRSFITYITLSKGIEVSVYGDSLVSAVCQWRPDV